MFEGVPLVAGLAAATYAAWRSYVAARSAVAPLIREGDPTRTLIEGTRPVYTRSRVRIAVRNVAVSLGWLVVAMYGLFLASAGMALQGRVGVAAVTATAERVAAVLDRYEAVVGIEIHCQLKTASKMFCGCSTAYDGAPPNTHVCPVCLGLPGALPVINRRAVEFVIATGLAIEAHIPERTQWERKNYFYPDLPKGYQISQYAIPLAARRAARRSRPRTARSRSRSRRAHLEEDTAKLVHGDTAGAGGSRATLVDFNRSGAPLMEIVTEPEIRTAEQARRYAEELQLLLRAIGASDADMERGQMRVEANVSLRPRGEEPFGTRVEVKNMNSFRSVERAIAFEIERQAAAARRRRSADDGDARLGRRPAGDVSHAGEGDLGRLSLLSGARPAAAPRRRAVDRRAPRHAARAARRPSGALRGPRHHPLRRRGASWPIPG